MFCSCFDSLFFSYLVKLVFFQVIFRCYILELVEFCMFILQVVLERGVCMIGFLFCILFVILGVLGFFSFIDGLILYQCYIQQWIDVWQVMMCGFWDFVFLIWWIDWEVFWWLVDYLMLGVIFVGVIICVEGVFESFWDLLFFLVVFVVMWFFGVFIVFYLFFGVLNDVEYCYLF